jgi:hypothetical protein
MTDPWVCIDCGARQPEQGKCAACGHEDTLDARQEKVRELMRDVDLRLGLRREGRCRAIGVAVGIGTIFALWMVPGYWGLRGRLYPGIPLLLDQWFFMALIGFLVSKTLEKKLGKRRFPYLRDDLTIS